MSGIGEKEIIGLVEKIFGDRDAKGAPGVPVTPGVILGIGDDCAAIKPSPGAQILITTDTLIEGVHFSNKWMTPGEAGEKSVTVSVSDIAAMAGIPKYLALSMNIGGRVDIGWIRNFLRGFAKGAKSANCAVIGGNVAMASGGGRGSLSFTVTALGEVLKGLRIDRSGARPGDTVFITGAPGDSALGLKLLKSRRTKFSASEKALVKRHKSPTPRIEWGALLGREKIASAMIDVSDGVALDLRRILEASGVNAELELVNFPLSKHAAKIVDAKGEAAWRTILSGGEDYELIFTVGKKNLARLSNLREAGKIVCAPIGKIGVGKPDIKITGPTGAALDLEFEGWWHSQQ